MSVAAYPATLLVLSCTLVFVIPYPVLEPATD